jgi:hypothetical protein
LGKGTERRLLPIGYAVFLLGLVIVLFVFIEFLSFLAGKVYVATIHQDARLSSDAYADAPGP